MAKIGKTQIWAKMAKTESWPKQKAKKGPKIAIAKIEKAQI